MPPRLDAAAWHQLCAVNDEVNRETRYTADAALYGRPDFWEVAAGAGDCEDYALAKRQRLRDLGWPEAALRLATCLYRGEGHAVLTVDSDAGVWVLDNRYAQPQPWKILPYTWLEREAPAGSAWETVPATT